MIERELEREIERERERVREREIGFPNILSSCSRLVGLGVSTDKQILYSAHLVKLAPSRAWVARLVN